MLLYVNLIMFTLTSVTVDTVVILELMNEVQLSVDFCIFNILAMHFIYINNNELPKCMYEGSMMQKHH